MRKSYLLVMSVSFSLLSGVVHADSASEITHEETQLVSKNPNAVDISGYIDTSYNYLLRNNRFKSGNYDRGFDLEPNGFTLQQASITFAKQPPQGLGALFNFLVGRDANTLAAYGMNPNFGIQNIGYDIPQAFVQYAVKSNVFMVGKINSIPGIETADPAYDSNFSRSLNDSFGQPGTILGARNVYAVNNQIELTIGINNGWDNIRDTSRRKTIELGMSYTPNKIFSINISGYSGEQRATDMVSTGPKGTRDLINVAATLRVTDKLDLAVNADYAMQTKAALPNDTFGQAVWKGIVGYINYQLNDKWETSVRGEVFDDSNGYRTGVAQNLREITLTLGYSPIKNLILRAETRHDFSNVSSFFNANRVGTSNNQQSYALEAFFLFS